MVNKENVIYFNQGHRRRKQIHEFIIEDIQSNPTLSSEFLKIVTILKKGNTETAFKRFIILLGVMSDITVSGYLVEENAKLFGKTKVHLDIFNGVFRSIIRNLKKGKFKKKKEQLRQTTVKEITKEIKEEKRNVIFGISKTGKKKSANIVIVFVKEKAQTRLRDIKTGRFLKYTETFKKQIEENKKLE